MLEPSEQHSGKETIFNLLNSRHVNYLVIDHLPSQTITEITDFIGVPELALVKAIMLQDKHGLLMAIIPNHSFFDIGQLCVQLDRELELATKEALTSRWEHSDQDNIPPFPAFFNIAAVMDNSILQFPEIYFKPSVSDTIICMKLVDFMQFQLETRLGNFTVPLGVLAKMASQEGGMGIAIKKLTPIRIKQRAEKTVELPAIPMIAGQILKLRFDPKATAHDLGKLVEMDPSLAAQLMAWAQSPYYGYPGKITSVDNAIINVLGFDLVMNLALGIALGKAMRVHKDGPLGLRQYWYFAVYCAAVIETIMNMMPVKLRPIRGLAYLSGLLHNFGHLLLAQVFPPHFSLLNRYVLSNPQVSLLQIEHFVLGVGHDEIGAWLLEAWHLPKEVITAMRCHHDENYDGEDAIYANLVLLATRLLKRHNLGDSGEINLPTRILDSIGISENQALEALDFVMSQREDLAVLANQLIGK